MQHQHRHPSPLAQAPHITGVRRHHLVVGTRGAISAFCHLPSACTGIAPSTEWARLHSAWAARSARGLFTYTLSTAGAAGQINVTCVDCSCVMPTSGNAMSRGALQALLRPPSLSRQLVAAASYTLVPTAAGFPMDTSSVGSSSQNYMDTRSSTTAGGGGGFTNAANTVALSASMQINQQQLAGGASSNAANALPTMPPASARHGKHSHASAYVVTTVFILVDMTDARTRDVARECAKALDQECGLLNTSMGNVPQFVFVALTDQRKGGSSSSTMGGNIRSVYPEVLLQDVLEMTQALSFASHRVDEVTLI